MRSFAGLLLVLGLFMGPALAEEAAPQSEVEAVAEPAAAAGVQFLDGNGKALGELVKSVTLSGVLRSRIEVVENLLTFDDDLDDSADYVDNLVRLGLGFELVDGVSALVELQVNEVWGANTVGADEDVDIYQAYVDIETKLPFGGADGSGLPITVRIGRHEIVLGDEMLLGDDSYYDGLTHDAVHVMGDDGAGFTWSLVLGRSEEEDVSDIAAVPALRVAAGAGVSEEEDDNLYALCGTYTGLQDTTIDGYLIIVDDNEDTAVAEETRYTLGGRVATSYALDDKNVLDGKLELAYQFGDDAADGDGDGDNDGIGAFAAEFEIGWTPNKGDPEWEARFALGLNFASGDDDLTDDDAETFDPLSGDVHERLGKADVLVLSNIMAYYLEAVAKPVEQAELGITYLIATAEEDNAAGDDDILDELDLWAGYTVTENLSLEAGVAIVMPDDWLVGAGGPDDNAFRVFIEANVKW